MSSTGAVYKSEDLYSVNKQLEENFYIEYSKKFNFSLDVARIFACIGPYYNKHDFYAFSSFMNKAIKGETIIIKSLREVYRSYIYIPNLILVFTLVLPIKTVDKILKSDASFFAFISAIISSIS